VINGDGGLLGVRWSIILLVAADLLKSMLSLRREEREEAAVFSIYGGIHMVLFISARKEHFGDIKEAFETGSNEVVWREEFESIVNFLGMKRFTNREVLDFATRVGTGDKDLWNKYWNELTKGRPQEKDCTSDAYSSRAVRDCMWDDKRDVV
jgi:hypothetical protein